MEIKYMIKVSDKLYQFKNKPIMKVLFYLLLTIMVITYFGLFLSQGIYVNGCFYNKKVDQINDNSEIQYKRFSKTILISTKGSSQGTIIYDIDLSKYNHDYTKYKIIKTDSFDSYSGTVKIQYPDGIELNGIFFRNQIKFIGNGIADQVEKSIFKGIIINRTDQLNPNPAVLVYIALQIGDQFRGNYTIFVFGILIILIGLIIFSKKMVIRNILVISGIITLVGMLFIPL
jgi:hypothetical protein